VKAALHFLLIGALLYTANESLAPRSEARGNRVIEIPASRVDELRRSWLETFGIPPTEEELDSQIQRIADEEILFREALTLGLHRRDPVAQSRLIRNMRFLAGDSQRTDEDLLQEALALGMERSDLVVRRRLIQKLRLLWSEVGEREEPAPKEIERFILREPRLLVPARVRVSHVVLSRDSREGRIEWEARKLLAELTADAVPPERADEYGDAFLLRNHLPFQSELALSRSLGPGFASAVAQLEPGGWSGPVASSYGLHLVWVHERSAPGLHSTESLYAEALLAWRASQEQSAVRARLQELRTHYEVRVEGELPIHRSVR
jgi:hypothetical protein